MKKLLGLLTFITVLSTPGAMAVGKIQNEDVKSETDLTNAGSDKTHLVNDSKVYVTALGINDRLDNAIVGGQLGGGSGGGVQYLSNSGFESGTTATGWTITAATGSAETSIIYAGKQSEKLVMSAQTGSIKQSVTPTFNTNGVNIEASCKVNTTATTIQVCGLSNAVIQNCQSVPSTGTWQYISAAFVGPSNGTSVGVIVQATSSTTGTVYVDDCYVGPLRNSITNSVTGTSTPASWSGYHTTASSWSTTLGTYQDSTVSGTPVLVQVQNRNFGTVTTASSSRAGITFTPPRVGMYYVCATPKVSLNINNLNGDVRLWDGTTVIAEAQTYYGSGAISIPVCGIWQVTSAASAATLSLQLKTGGGQVYISAAGSNRSDIEWSIIELDAPMPTPFLTNMVQTTLTTGIRIEAASIQSQCTTSTCTLTANTGGYSSITRIGTGTYQINMVAGTFTTSPVCTVTSAAWGTTQAGYCTMNGTTQVNCKTNSTTLTLQDDGFDIICVGGK